MPFEIQLTLLMEIARVSKDMVGQERAEGSSVKNRWLRVTNGVLLAGFRIGHSGPSSCWEFFEDTSCLWTGFKGYCQQPFEFKIVAT